MKQLSILKECSSCKNILPRNAIFFHREKQSEDGLRGQCKECRSDYNKKHRKRNKKRIAKYKRQHYKNNKESYREWGRRHRKENIDSYREREKRYREEHQEWYREYEKSYRKINSAKIKRIQQRRRAKKLNLPHTLTVKDWKQALEFFNNRCSYCSTSQNKLSETLQQEHIISVKNNGGYVKENIIPACSCCNKSKSSRDMEEWYREQKFFTEEPLNKIKQWQSI